MTIDFNRNSEWIKRFTGEDAPLIKEGEIEEWIVYEDDHILAINKPGWLVCHPSKQGPMSSLVGAAKVYLDQEKLHLVSRLDRETSGIVLIAKHRKSASQYQKAVEARRVKKSYLVWVLGEMKEAVDVDKPLAKDLDSPVFVKQTVRKSNSSQSAITRYEPLHYDSNMNITVAKVIPHTGRKHQIRAHALWLGLPVYGDKIYGVDDQCYLDFIETGWTETLAEKLIFPRQALHASSLVFEGIEYKTDFHAPLTPDLVQLNQKIGLTAAL